MEVARSARLVAPLLLVAFVSLWAQGPPAAAPAAATDARFDRVADAVQAKMKELVVPGVALGVLNDGEVRTRAFGVTNIDHPLPVTDDTLFQIGSISKTFTGTAIMRLVEQGKLRLDDPIRTHLPRFAVKDADARTQHADFPHYALLHRFAPRVMRPFRDGGCRATSQ